MSDTKPKRIGIMADTHLRDAQYGRISRGADFRNAFIQAVEKLTKTGCQTIAHGGDLFDTSRPSSKQIDALCHVDHILGEAGAEMFIVSGNHDSTDPPWQSLRVLQNIQNADWKILESKCGAVFYGIPHASQQAQLDALDKFSAEPDFKGRPKIAVMHAPVRGFGIDFPWAISVSQLPVSNLAMLVLGDIHIARFDRLQNNCLIGYPGSTELCSFGEPLEKAVFYVDIEDNGVTDPVKIPLVTTDCREIRRGEEDSLPDGYAGVLRAVYNQMLDPDFPSELIKRFPAAIVLKKPEGEQIRIPVLKAAQMPDLARIVKEMSYGDNVVESAMLAMLKNPDCAWEELSRIASFDGSGAPM